MTFLHQSLCRCQVEWTPLLVASPVGKKVGNQGTDGCINLAGFPIVFLSKNGGVRLVAVMMLKQSPAVACFVELMMIITKGKTS